MAPMKTLPPLPSLPSLAAAIAACGLALAPGAASADRSVVPLDGPWQIAEGGMDAPPAAYAATAPVPGLADMATPAFDSPGSTVSAEDRGKPWLRPADPRREAFWYRRTFRLDGDVPAVALLKVNKARYGTKVFVNGAPVGEHAPNFTPGWFDVRAMLKGGGAENEVVIRVGASLAQVPPHLTDGWDNEKSRYIPGIYDSVSLVLCGTPHVVNVQAAPDVPGRAVRAAVEIANAGAAGAPVDLKAVVREAKSGREAGSVRLTVPAPRFGTTNAVDVTVPIRAAHPWTPEDPFLYTLEIDTGADTATVRFGLRSFASDPASGRFLLNGTPCYLRGSNVCIYRFFEDAERGALPWDREWVRTLHRRFRDMHWNSLRYCIGFPPEAWYEIADEEGILIQDEFPIWYSRAKDGWPEAITPDHLAVEYTEWMRERWNHPCVVLWDAQNETANDRVTAAALQAVRGLDRSNRPWDNGWGAPQRPGDVSEAHPYRSSRPGFSLARLGAETGIPDNGPRRNTAAPPYLINEYAWLWINRDGSLPTLTVEVYKRLLGEDAAPEARFALYARLLAAKTEFWRARRRCAGVLHFCGLGYSRADGQTSDNFRDVRALVYEPHFYEHVRDAFAPVGVAIDWWAERAAPGETLRVPVRVINDPDAPWKGEVTLRLERDGAPPVERRRPAEAAPLGTADVVFEMPMPAEPCAARLVASIPGADGTPVRSLRDVRVAPLPVNLAAGRPATASTEIRNNLGFFPAALAVDGDPGTRWSSVFTNRQWLAVNLGGPRRIGGARIAWEAAHGRVYAVEVSADGASWKEVWTTDKGRGGEDDIRFPPVEARHVRLRCDTRATPHGFSVWEFEVFDAPEK